MASFFVSFLSHMVSSFLGGYSGGSRLGLGCCYRENMLEYSTGGTTFFVIPDSFRIIFGKKILEGVGKKQKSRTHPRVR